jgi:hypothetical protein
MGWTRDTIIKVAQRTGYPVVEAWSSHDYGQMGTVYGPLMHHTGTSGASGDYPTLQVVRDGRAGLENSLCMYGIGKSGTIYCVSEKISWHAGVGSWRGLTDGNGHLAGIEAESSGANGDWTPQQLDAYQKLVASILIETGNGLEWAPTHREFALPPGRKTDPSGFDLAAFRNVVQMILNNHDLLNTMGDDLVGAIDTPIPFTNPDGVKTNYSLGTHIAYTNFYVGKIYDALVTKSAQPVADAVWATQVSRLDDSGKVIYVPALQELADAKTAALAAKATGQLSVDQLKQLLTDAVKEGVAAGNADEADQIVQRLVEKLANG